MTKKKRRTRARPGSGSQRPIQERREQLAATPSGRQQPARVSATARDTAGRYQHVIPELKRIGIIAGATILVLIILSFVLV